MSSTFNVADIHPPDNATSVEPSSSSAGRPDAEHLNYNLPCAYPTYYYFFFFFDLSLLVNIILLFHVAFSILLELFC